jgi:phage baseplate assembly protein W
MASKIDQAYLVDLKHSGDLEGTPSGDILEVTGKENLRQAVIHRLITSKGSLIHRPEYGVGLKNYQNRLSTLSTQRELANEIKKQLESDPRIESVDSVKFTQETENQAGTFRVLVKYTAVAIGEIDQEVQPFGDF